MRNAGYSQPPPALEKIQPLPMCTVDAAAITSGINSLDLVPGLYGSVPAWLRPLFDSSLTLTTVIAVVLTQLLRGGAPTAATPAAAE